MGWSSNNYYNGRTAFFLCIFLGWFGAHRFYCNRTITGFLYLFTAGFWGIGVIIDLFLIAYGKFRVRNNGLFSRMDSIYGWSWWYSWNSDEVPRGYKKTCWVILSIPILIGIGFALFEQYF
jgi:TM2 domain-containing membrane protein YozV